MKPMETRRAELYEEISHRVCAECQNLGLDIDMARHIGAAMADLVAEIAGGQVISFPKDAAYQLSLREQEILHAHQRGANYLDLMFKYKMSERGVRKLLKRATLRHGTSLRQQALEL
jgi:Mor family transcriptional regulator